jgi:phage terminase large subunit-like protein
MNPDVQLALDLAEQDRRRGYKFNRYFPDCQPTCRKNSPDPAHHAGFCRALYVKHMAFVAAARAYRERMFMAANRIGKTDVAAYEVTAHLTGLYPSWWEGMGGIKFDRPNHWWAAGDTMLSTRDILQVALLGRIEGLEVREFTGMVHGHLIEDFTRRSGSVSDCVDQIYVRHVTGGASTLQFKSYDQGRRLFQGTAQDGIWLDEEPSEDVYAECLLRTMTTKGLILATLTPLQGMTAFIQSWIDSAVMPDTEGDVKPATELMGEAR